MTHGPRRYVLSAGLLALALAGAGAAQSARTDVDVTALSNELSVRRALNGVRRTESDTIREQIRICEVPAPPFGEAPRARLYANAMREVGLANVRIDAAGNVLGERRGRAQRPHLVLSAHLDTVFPADTTVKVRREGAVLRGPGIGDDCRGLAVILAVARAMRDTGVQTEGSITFVGTVGEEGLGDLRGVKALFHETLKGKVDRFISVDGDGYSLTNVGVGSRRYRVTYRGPGGHSYDDFGRASPVSALGLSVAAISRIEVPATPRTTRNVGRVGGGTSINAIPGDAWMEIDLRSSDEDALSNLDAKVKAAIQEALEVENGRRKRDDPLILMVEPVGNRPAGRTAVATPMVRTAAAVLKTLGLPARFDEGSTDANLPMSIGIPSLTVGGGGSGRDAHSPRESFDTTDSWKGTQMVTLLAIALAR